MTSAFRVVLLLLGLSLLAGAVTGSSLYYRLSYLWGALLLGSWVMARLSLRGLRVQRSARTLRSQVGQLFEERFQVINTSRLPRLWVEVQDEAALPGSRGSRVLTLIGPREAYTYLARTRLSERGVFPLGPTVLLSGDLFGLFEASRSMPSQESLLVYPLMVDVTSFPGPAGLLPGGEALRRRTAQITSNAAGVREYAPGDPLNRIHWLSTARRDRMMVKEFELDPLAEVWLFVDGSHSVHAELPYEAPVYDLQDIWRPRAKFSLPPSSVEYTASAAASLARYFIGRSRAVGLVSAGPFLKIIPSERGNRQLGKLLEALAVFRAEGNVPLSGLIEAQARHLPRGSTVVFITPAATRDVVISADFLLRSGLRPVAVVLDSASFGGYYGVDKIAPDLEALGIPVFRVRNGDDLGAVLSVPQTPFTF